MFIIAALLALLVLAAAFFPQLFTQESPTDCNIKYSLQGPGPGHILGYNTIGCDIFARTVYGTRASLFVGVFATVGILLIGGVFGVLAGFFGGWLDSIVTWVSSVIFAFPLILGVFLITYLPMFNGEKSLWTTALPITLFSWPIMARIARAAVINVKDADFVLAVRALGASRRNIVFRHILPNSIAPIITTAIFSLGGFIALEATLSYLGYQPPDTRHQMVYDLGMPASVLSWANDIASGVLVIRSNPEVIAYPSIALVVTILSFLLLGDAIGNALNPKTRKQ